VGQYSNVAPGSAALPSRAARPPPAGSDAGLPFIVPELCNATALSLLVLFGELLVLVLVFATGEFDWLRFALLSLFVQWVALTSAGLLCGLRERLATFGVVPGALLAFALVLAVTLVVGLVAQQITDSAWQRGGFDWALLGSQLVISGIITALALRYFYVQQQLRAQEQSELEARLQALQSRIRPHFLFNSMNIIASLIGSDPDTAETVVEDLSQLFRASLNEAGNQVPLAEELDLCERYVRIEALRLGDRLAIDWQIDCVPAGVKIPLLTLQPLLENAIYHGIQPLPEGGRIDVEIRCDDDRVRVRIRNPLPPPEQRTSTSGNKMALNNIRSRLSVLYGAGASLTTQAQGDSYLTLLEYPRASETS